MNDQHEQEQQRGEDPCQAYAESGEIDGLLFLLSGLVLSGQGAGGRLSVDVGWLHRDLSCPIRTAYFSVPAAVGKPGGCLLSGALLIGAVHCRCVPDGRGETLLTNATAIDP